jgi:hypothetical protein
MWLLGRRIAFSRIQELTHRRGLIGCKKWQREITEVKLLDISNEFLASVLMMHAVRGLRLETKYSN